MESFGEEWEQLLIDYRLKLVQIAVLVAPCGCGSVMTSADSIVAALLIIPFECAADLWLWPPNRTH